MQGIRKAGRPRRGESRVAFVKFRDRNYELGAKGGLNMVESWDRESRDDDAVQEADQTGSQLIALEPLLPLY